MGRLLGLYGDRALELWKEPLFSIGGVAVSPVFLAKASVANPGDNV